MRVYVPSSRPLLAAWVAAGTVPAESPERSVPADTDEESEYAALMTAAADSRAAGADERVVVVAEVPGDDPDEAFALDRVVAVHADETSGARGEDDLSWFAPEELGTLLT